jgi:hypothetical protein
VARQIVTGRCPDTGVATARRRAVNVAIAVAVCAACSRARPGNPCEQKLVGQADVAGIMTSPVVKTEALEGDPQSCIFSTATGGTITVMVRPGLGNVSVSSWERGQMHVPAAPMAGVGDRAVWQDTMNEVLATKNDVLCDISVMGPPGTAAAGAQRRLGELCNRIFSRQ